MARYMMRQMILVEQLIRAALRSVEQREEGQALVEYAMILVLVAVLIVASLKFLQPAISTQLNNVTNSF